jgi:hypothetical protein
MKKDAYYFSHDANARHDPKLSTLCMTVGICGYSYFFMLIEMLREQTDFVLKKELRPCLVSLWGSYGNPMDTLKADEILASMMSLGLVSMDDDGGIYSASLNERMQELVDRRNKFVESGKKGAEIRYGRAIATLKLPHSDPIARKEKKREEKTIGFSKAFEALWSRYPRKVEKETAYRHFCKSVVSDIDYAEIQSALTNYLSEIRKNNTESKFIKMGSTWFNNWRDWIPQKKAVPIAKPATQQVIVEQKSIALQLLEERARKMEEKNEIPTQDGATQE